MLGVLNVQCFCNRKQASLWIQGDIYKSREKDKLKDGESCGKGKCFKVMQLLIFQLIKCWNLINTIFIYGTIL